MHSNITIRPSEAADTGNLLSIWFAASIEAHGFIGKAQLREQRVAIEQTYLPNAETWVACEMQKPLGFISLIDAFVGGLFVSPEHQGRGIGRMLIQHAAAQNGSLQLEVYTANARAYGFYASLGFKELSRRSEDDQGLPFENARMGLSA